MCLPGKRRNGEVVRHLRTFLLVLLTLISLHGCGHKGSSGSSQNTVRLVNGTSNTLDMVTGGTILASGVAYGTPSGDVTLLAGSYLIELEDTGTGIPSGQFNLTFSAAAPFTLLAYMASQNLQIAQFVDDEPAPASGDGKIRIADLSTDAGSVDVYVSTDNNPLHDVYAPGVVSPALLSAQHLVQISFGSSSYSEVPANTYHIWVTGAGDKTDLRLDMPSTAIADQQISTLALTSTTGGALLDGLLVNQQGAVVARQNTNARMRIAANTTTDLTSATAANLSLLGGVSPFNSDVGSYVLVPAGSTPIALSSGTGIGSCASPVTTVHGEDLTLLVTAATCTVLTDDNTRPLGSFAKLRLVNGVNGGGNISLEDNSVLIASDVASGGASVPTANGNQGLVSSASLSNLTVSPSTPAFSAPNVTLLPESVYSLFMLGSSSAVTGVLTHDR
jgi:Domain of unknown function (DUF4397)